MAESGPSAPGQQHAVGSLEHLDAPHRAQPFASGRVGASADPVGGGLQLDGRAELGLQAVLGDFELERADRREHRCLLAEVGVTQDLDDALLAQLGDAAAELLRTADVGGAGDREVLRGEARDRRVGDWLVGPQRVADPDVVGVDEADDVTRERVVEGLTLLAEHRVRVLRRERLAGAGVGDDHAALEPAGADAEERAAVTVCPVGVGLDLEHEPGERRVQRPGRAVGKIPPRAERPPASGSCGTPPRLTTPIAPGVATPDKLETSIGTLKLNTGFGGVNGALILSHE